MARYYFHIRRGDELIEDPDGSELPDIEAARQEALQSAREILAHRVMNNDVIDGEQFEVHDTNGESVITVPFRSALRFD